MFSSNHYVPILRWKAAEKEALLELEVEKKEFITPVIELIMPRIKSHKIGVREKTPAELLSESLAHFRIFQPKITGEISKYWGIFPAFIDVNLLDVSLRAETLRGVLKAGELIGLTLVPVISLESDEATRKVAISESQKHNHGLCLRLFRSDVFNKETLRSRIESALKSAKIRKGTIDLLVDFQITDEQCLKISDLVKDIPDITAWRTLTVASGAFPPDLVHLSVDVHFIDRMDWRYWSNLLDGSAIIRKPSFGDYTIQHPIYKEPVRGANPSASIRYTLNDRWMIMRGQALRSPKSAGHAQYPALAQLVSRRSEFFGENFSYGDWYIAKTGKDIKTEKTGNPRTWLRAGINHHLTCVVSQIAGLP